MLNILEEVYNLVVDDRLSPSTETEVLEALDSGQFILARDLILDEMYDLEQIVVGRLEREHPVNGADLERHGWQSTMAYLLQKYIDNN